MHDTPPRKFNLVQMHRIRLSIHVHSQVKEQNKILSQMKDHNSVCI